MDYKEKLNKLYNKSKESSMHDVINLQTRLLDIKKELLSVFDYNRAFKELSNIQSELDILINDKDSNISDKAKDVLRKVGNFTQGFNMIKEL